MSSLRSADLSASPTVIVCMGVSGCGKSTVASLLSLRLGCPFYEGDAYHPASNIEKMRAGAPLDDSDRLPWLARLAAIIEAHCSSGQLAVLSCSALKPAYRRLLRGQQPLVTAGGSVLRSGQERRVEGEGPGEALREGCVLGNDEVLAGGSRNTWQEGAASDANEATQAEPSIFSSSNGGGTSNASTEPARQTDGNAVPSGDGAKEGTVSPPASSGVGFVLLDPSRAQLQRWVEERAAAGGHFMPPSLLDSQLAALQYSEEELYMHFWGDPFPCPEVIADHVLQRLGTAGGGGGGPSD